MLLLGLILKIELSNATGFTTNIIFPSISGLADFFKHILIHQYQLTEILWLPLDLTENVFT